MCENITRWNANIVNVKTRKRTSRKRQEIHTQLRLILDARRANSPKISHSLAQIKILLFYEMCWIHKKSQITNNDQPSSSLASHTHTHTALLSDILFISSAHFVFIDIETHSHPAAITFCCVLIGFDLFSVHTNIFCFAISFDHCNQWLRARTVYQYYRCVAVEIRLPADNVSVNM